MALTILGFIVLKTSVLLFQVWPTGGDVPFVWQTALAQAAQSMSAEADLSPAAIAGWSPDTLDGPTLTLLLNGRAAPSSHFQPGEGSLILPDSLHPVVIRPAALPLHPFWEAQLLAWGAQSVHEGQIVRYNLPVRPELSPELVVDVSFGGEIELMGLTIDGCAAGSACGLTTIWRVTAVPAGARQLFFQVLDEDGHLTAEGNYFDRQDPQSLWFPHWQIGDYLLQRHLLPPTETAVELRLGWFDPYTCSPGPCKNLLTESGAGFVVLPLPDRGDKP